VVSDDRLGDGCSDGVDLCGDTSTLHSDADIEVGELFLSEDKNGFENLQSHDLGLDVLDRLAINLDETPSLFSERDGGGRLFPEKSTRGGREKKSDTIISKLNNQTCVFLHIMHLHPMLSNFGPLLRG
jgi:hypothetical protein